MVNKWRNAICLRKKRTLTPTKVLGHPLATIEKKWRFFFLWVGTAALESSAGEIKKRGLAASFPRIIITPTFYYTLG